MWPTRFWDKDWSQLGAGMALTYVAGLALRSETAIEILGLSISSAYVLFFLRALGRLWQDEREQARIRSLAGMRRQRRRSWSAAAGFVLWVVTTAALRLSGSLR